MADRCKYQKLQYQVSYNNGSTWENVTPIQVMKGDVIEYMSRDCSEIETLYRWVDLEGTYVCDGNNKYTRQIQEESYDNGVSWYASYPTVYQQGTFVGVDEEYCCDKFVGHYMYNDTSSGETPSPSHSCRRGYMWNGRKCIINPDPLKVVKCNGNPTLTRGETLYYTSNYELIDGEIGDTVSSISAGAFSGYTSLTSITIPNSVASIGNQAFYNCITLSSITIPSSVTTIGLWAFQYCRGLTNITIENGLTSIAEAAFEYCRSLTSVTLPSSITSIGFEPFNGCTGLTSITILATTPPAISYNHAFSNTNNCPIYVPCDSLPLYRGDSNWGVYCDRLYPIQPCTSPTPTGATKFYATYQDGFAYFKYCDSNTNLVTADTQAACSNYKSMVEVEIGNCVTSIGNRAFQRFTSLTSITIPNSVTSIGDSSFQYCSSLTSIDIPDSVTSIDTYAFYSCASLTSVTVLATTPPSLGSFAFDYTSNNLLIYVPCGSVNAYRSASGWRNRASRILGIPPCEEPPTPTGATKLYATYPNGIPYFVYCDSNSGLTSTTTKGGQFGYKTIRSAEIGSCITSIENTAFSGFSSLSSVTIPNSVTSIGDSTFSECSSLESIYIPDSVTYVGIRAFEFCRSATSITIGSSVTNIGDYAFIYCRNISSITCLAIVPPAIGQGIFEDAANCPIYVPSQSVNAYKTASGWSRYADRIQAIP